MQSRVNSLRRASYSSSTSSLRRSSVSSRDVIAIQQALLRQRALSTHTVGILIALLPALSLVLLYAVHQHGSSLYNALWSLCFRWPFGLQALPPIADPVAWKVVSIFISVQLLLYEVLPRDTVVVLNGAGEPTKRESNAFASSIVLSLAYILGAVLKLYRGDLIYQHFPAIIGVLGCLAVSLLFYLHVRCQYTDAPTMDSLHEYFFGVEVEPTILEINIKHFIRSRLTMGIYLLFTISALHFSYSTTKTMHIMTGMAHIFYALAWQWCEDVHLNGLDAKICNLGFGRLWADLVLYPVLYTSPIAIVVMQKKHMSTGFSYLFAIAAILCTILMYSAARQRLSFRLHKGNIKISGADPYFTAAKFRMDNGETGANLLLGSGWWGYCRHPSYTFDIAVHASLTALTGSVGPAGHASFIVLFVYYLIRIHYDENRCLAKYGAPWQQLCSHVHYKLVPGIY